ESQDVLVVTKLDRLGRNAMDVRSTVELLETRGVKVHCLALGGVDLTSAAGKMTMQVLSAVAEFERDLLVERTQAGLARARKEGKRAGRPPAFTPEQKTVVLQKIQAGTPIAQIA
ncbi:recombinase family protein, partial [Yersinia pestis]